MADPLTIFGVEPASTGKPTKPDRQPLFRPRTIGRCMADVETCEIRWLWPDKIPRGRLTVLAGDGGVGKSFLSLSIAATLSRGDAWPDQPGCKQEPGNSVLLNAEDDPSDTLRVRLDAAGADSSRIFIVEGVERTKDGELAFFSLADDLRALEDTIVETDAQLCVVDPIGAFMNGIDTHRDSSIRGVLDPLAMMAARTDCAVVAVLHLNKSSTSKVSHRVTGSVAWTNATRMAWLVGADPENDQRRLMLPYKFNVISSPTGLAFEISEGAVRWFSEPATVDPDSILAADGQDKTEKSEAADWLTELLAVGPIAVSEIRKASEAEGHSWRTLARVKKTVGVVSKREGFGKRGVFVWEIPAVASNGELAKKRRFPP